MFVKMPGWKPKELGGIEKPKEVTVTTFHKYNTEIPSGLNYYVLFQFVIVLAGATLFLIFETKEPFGDNMLLKLAAASLIIFSLLNIGGIFEKKKWVPALEYLRMVLLSVLVFLLLRNSPFFMIVGAITGVVVVVSFLWFSRYKIQFRAEPTGEQR